MSQERWYKLASQLWYSMYIMAIMLQDEPHVPSSCDIETLRFLLQVQNSHIREKLIIIVQIQRPEGENKLKKAKKMPEKKKKGWGIYIRRRDGTLI